jgi:hypothetical protein
VPGWLCDTREGILDSLRNLFLVVNFLQQSTHPARNNQFKRESEQKLCEQTLTPLLSQSAVPDRSRPRVY